MELGNNIYNLRKNAKLSQEQLAEKLNVTRQTISNWELGQTVPDIIQAKEISKIFNITLDEIVENDIRDVLVEKISNTEKLATKTMNILKFFMVIIILLISILIVAVNIYIVSLKMDNNYKNEVAKELKNENISDTIRFYKTKVFYVTINGNEYQYEISYDTENYKIKSVAVGLASGKDTVMEQPFSNFDYKDARELIDEWKQYVEINGGTWKDAQIARKVTDSEEIEGKLYLTKDSTVNIDCLITPYNNANPKGIFILELTRSDEKESLLFGHVKIYLPANPDLDYLQKKYSIGLLYEGEYTYRIKSYVDVSGEYRSNNEF